MPTFASTNPARPAEVIIELQSQTGADVDQAVRAAAVAQHAWARRPVPERAEAIATVGDVLRARKSALAELVSREAGKIRVEGGGEVQEAIDMAAFVAGQGRAAMGEVVPSELEHKLAWTTRTPIGVVGMITPWNFPVAIPSWKVFPALLAGNGVVIKPSELAPACCVAFVEACVDAGIPTELLQVVHGAAEPASALAVHPGVGAVSFTGSVPTGRLVASAAMAVGPKVVSLELGGKNAMVVLDDADLDLAVDGALFGAFGSAGQRCTSTSRLVVQRGIARTLLDRLVDRTRSLRLGDPLVSTTDVGPVITSDSAVRIMEMVDAAVADGATVLTGGGLRNDVAGCDGGMFIEPTILVGVDAAHRAAREEMFGPVLSVIEVDDLAEAVRVVNGVDFGLSASIYTRDINRALVGVEAIDTGITYVNAPTIGAEIPLPFGGTKHTGNGFREAGARGIEQFSQIKTVYVDYSGRLQRAQIDNRADP
ncbi:MAG: aldehyde dehydrogenase family protein [Acidimicrobiales bacterium]